MRRRAAIAVMSFATLALACAASPSALAHTGGGVGFAGYLATPSSGVSSVSADFTVPVITCPNSDSYGVWPSLFVDSTAGNAFGGGVQATCSSGSAAYEAGVVLDGTNTGVFAVAGGDKMSVKVSVDVSTGAVTVKIKDLTHAASAAKSCTSSCGTFSDGADARFADNAVTSAGVPTFTSNAFTHALVNGDALGSFAPTASDMGPTKDPWVVSSAISKNENFTDTFEQNS